MIALYLMALLVEQRSSMVLVTAGQYTMRLTAPTPPAAGRNVGPALVLYFCRFFSAALLPRTTARSSMPAALYLTPRLNFGSRFTTLQPYNAACPARHVTALQGSYRLAIRCPYLPIAVVRYLVRAAVVVYILPVLLQYSVV